MDRLRGLFPRRGPLEPRLDRPFPAWAIFPLLFVGVYLTHLSLLRLPYYWDEAGYYIPAAYDFFRTGSLIPSSTLSNAHPPIPSIYLAMWWKASGFLPAVTRVAMCLVTAIALLGVYELSRIVSRRPQIAAAVTLLTAIYPVWFAQSTLAHADMFAAAGTLWGLAFFFAALHDAAPEPSQPAREPRGRRDAIAAAVCFSLAALSKETAIVTPVALALWLGYRLLRAIPRENRKPHLRLALCLLAPIFPLAAWYGYHRWRTGYFFGNPEFVRYNAISTLSPLRIGLALAHRLLQLTGHMNMFVPVFCALGALMLLPLPERDGSPSRGIAWPDQAALYTVLITNGIFFSVVGGALLTRYLLPLYPLVLLLCASTMRRRVPYWWALVGLSAAAFLLGLWINPPYKFAPEDNLNYADVIRLHQQAIHQIVTNDPGSTVLTAWPATDELTKPELGYVRKPVPVVKMEDFSLASIQKAAASGSDATVCFAFSTKYDPPNQWMSLGGRNESFDIRFFGFHKDLDPQEIAHRLDGSIVWWVERNNEWAAVLHLNRPQTAGLQQDRLPGPDHTLRASRP
ncbi:MAG TPA: glycosyltransferase family 39 protein [Acidobacteriaceae bacterium]|nr:glycosyltransferase family 39 protein [Acidobacteriaceae bacterium]